MLKTVLNKAATNSYATREGILRRARMLVPKLAARSEKAEQLRRCPDETIADFTEAGLLRVCQPKRYGGYDLGYDVLCEMVQTLAQGCGSQAWVAMVLADNPLKFSAFEISAQDEVWGANQEAKIAVAILPVVGRATPAQGGMRWSATHRFSSGIDHADYRSDVERICSRVREMVPPPGASREWAAIWFLHARDEVVIKLAGLVGERLRYGHEFTRDAPGACDVVEAHALAETLVVAPEAVEELLRYCQTEAEAVVRKHWSSVEAVAAALEQCSTLSAAEIEGYIAVGVAADALAQEKRRREEWTRLIERPLPSTVAWR